MGMQGSYTTSAGFQVPERLELALATCLSIVIILFERPDHKLA